MRSRLLVAALWSIATLGLARLHGCADSGEIGPPAPASAGGGGFGGVAPRAGSAGSVVAAGAGGAGAHSGKPAGAGGSAAGSAGAAGDGGAAGKPKDDLPGWESFLRVRPDCVLRRPKAPLEQLVPALTWTPCEGASCVALATDWSDNSDDRFGARSVAIQGAAAEARWVTMVQVYDKYPGVRVTSAFELSTGTPLFAWASECLLKFASHTDELFLGYGDFSLGLQLLWGPPASISDQPRAKLPFTILNSLTLGAKYVAWDTFGLSMMPRSTGVPFNVPYDVLGESSFAQFAGDDAYFVTEAPRLRVWVRRDSGATEQLLAYPDAHVGKWASDGVTMAWMRLSAPGVGEVGAPVWESVELFASPHANNPSGVKPARLGRLTYLENKALGMGQTARNGVYSYGGGRPITFFRMSDGAFKTLPDTPPIPGTKWGELVWADDQEAFVVVLQGIQGKTVLRYRLDDLGPWKPLPQ